MKRQLITYDPSRKAGEQIKKPCSDCPWARDSLRGWLGGIPPEQWLAGAHGETLVECHVYSDVQCAGFAIFQANICKLPRSIRHLRLPADRKLVFTSNEEFRRHHCLNRTRE